MAKNTLSPKQQVTITKVTELKQSKTFSIKDSIGFQLATILKLKRRYIDLKMKKLGLSRTQWQVLLRMNILGSCTQKELLKNMDIDAAHLARVLEVFEKNKYIVRAAVKGDRRALFIQMTDQCKRQLVPYMENTLEKENAALVAGLNLEDKKYLRKFLQKLEENMELALNECQEKSNDK